MPQVFLDVDQVLGDAETRYFGLGHTRVRYAFVDHRLTRSATVSAAVQGSWSEKAAGEAAPHASTLDALLLSTHLAERYFAEALGYPEERIRRLRVAEAVEQAAAVITKSREAVARKLIEQQREPTLGEKLRLATRF
ncbi:MAG: hypothetical protein LBU05_02575 [Bifidobacteriaceae bacterium]|jgi:hypothetical protein|nr:hypothetical protein [Bifidobacteriaceae bacterium]